MPIYEFVCKVCGKRFSHLVLSADDQKDVKCPQCGSADVKRVFSPFGSLGSSTSSSSGGSCTSFG